LSLCKSKGIVLKSIHVGEADTIIHLFTDLGNKIKLIIKGIRKSKNRSALTTEVGSYLEIDYYNHKDREIFNTKEIHLIERYDKIKKNYLSFLVLNYLLELNDKLLPDNDSNDKSFKLLKGGIDSLEEYGFQMLILPYYKWKFLLIQGIVSSEFICNHCGRFHEDVDFLSLEQSSFQYICNICNSQKENNNQLIKLIKSFTTKNYKILLNESIPKELVSKLDQRLNLFMSIQFTVILKSIELLYQSLGMEKLDLKEIEINEKYRHN
jgi:DNA repair protein RecO (recombination protein O)